MEPLKRLFWWFLFAIRVVIRGIWCTTMIAIFVVSYFGYCVPLLIFKYAWPRFYWGIEGKMYRWLMACTGYWGYTAGYDVIEYGDDTSECEEDRVLVMCNHQSTADVPTLMTALQSKGTACRKTMWLMDIMFRWSPFGLISQMHGDHFIKQGKDSREKELENLQKFLRRVFWARDRRWIIVFPEGGFLYKRLESSNRYAAKHGFPHLVHTTLPRTGAVKAILEAVGPREGEDQEQIEEEHKRPTDLQLLKDTIGAIREKKYIKDTRPPIKYVLDLTIGYPEGIPLGLDTLCLGTRKQCDIVIHYKVHKVENVPFQDEIKLRDWLYERYCEKETLLANYYRTGELVPGESGRRLHFPLLKILIQYLFWFASAYMQYKCYGYLLRLIFDTILAVLPFS